MENTTERGKQKPAAAELTPNQGREADQKEPRRRSYLRICPPPWADHSLRSHMQRLLFDSSVLFWTSLSPVAPSLPPSVPLPQLLTLSFLRASPRARPLSLLPLSLPPSLRFDSFSVSPANEFRITTFPCADHMLLLPLSSLVRLRSSSPPAEAGALKPHCVVKIETISVRHVTRTCSLK